MASYFARVGLHGASWPNDYMNLHTELGKIGFFNCMVVIDQHGPAPLGEAERRRSWQPISAGLCQPAHCVHRSGPQTNDEVAGADEREGFLLGDCAVRNRSEDFRIEPRKARQLPTKVRKTCSHS